MLSSSVNRRNAGRWAPVALAGFILAACSSTQAPNAPITDFDAATQSSAYYLQQLQHSTDDNRSDWQILAIHALLSEGKFEQAGQQLQKLPQTLTPAQQNSVNLFVAQYMIHDKKFPLAQQRLERINPSSLSVRQKNLYYQLVIDAANHQVNLSVLRALIAQGTGLQAEAKQKNIDATWQALISIPEQAAASFNINANENILQGWLELLNTYYQNRNDQNALKNAINDWQTRYPDNPAARILPTGLQQTINLTTASTHIIALLLPLTGPGAVFSKAIELGFTDAHDGKSNVESIKPNPSLTQSSQTASGGTGATDAQAVISTAEVNTATMPASSVNNVESSAQIKIYDTNTQPIDQILKQVQQDGATLIVGPLLKNNVETVANTPLSLNVLALNEPATLKSLPNVCYFALSPENEARDAANHLWAEGKRTPLLMIPNSSLGSRIATAFAKQWQQLGGEGLQQQILGSSAELKQRINSSGLSLSGTPINPAPASPAISVAGMTFDAPVTAPDRTQSEQAVDSVYIVASQADLDLIKPMITMRIGSRSNIALYASSLSSQAEAGPDFRLEMEGLQYSDIPLLSGSNPVLMQQVLGRFNNDYMLSRLYAMGVDAWTLAQHFHELRQDVHYSVSGATGLLKANENCVINRTLSWNQYTQGRVIPVR